MWQSGAADQRYLALSSFHTEDSVSCTIEGAQPKEHLMSVIQYLAAALWIACLTPLRVRQERNSMHSDT